MVLAFFRTLFLIKMYLLGWRVVWCGVVVGFVEGFLFCLRRLDH